MEMAPFSQGSKIVLQKREKKDSAPAVRNGIDENSTKAKKDSEGH